MDTQVNCYKWLKPSFFNLVGLLAHIIRVGRIGLSPGDALAGVGFRNILWLVLITDSGTVSLKSCFLWCSGGVTCSVTHFSIYHVCLFLKQSSPC